MTAPDEVKFFKRGVEIVQETRQMQKRIEYVHLKYSIPEQERQEVLQHCGHCTARLYLEGRAQLAVAPARRLSSKTGPVTSAAMSSQSRSSNDASHPAEGSGLSHRHMCATQPSHLFVASKFSRSHRLAIPRRRTAAFLYAWY